MRFVIFACVLRRFVLAFVFTSFCLLFFVVVARVRSFFVAFFFFSLCYCLKKFVFVPLLYLLLPLPSFLVCCSFSLFRLVACHASCRCVVCIVFFFCRQGGKDVSVGIFVLYCCWDYIPTVWLVHLMSNPDTGNASVSIVTVCLHSHGMDSGYFYRLFFVL